MFNWFKPKKPLLHRSSDGIIRYVSFEPKDIKTFDSEEINEFRKNFKIRNNGNTLPTYLLIGYNVPLHIERAAHTAYAITIDLSLPGYKGITPSGFVQKMMDQLGTSWDK